MAKRNHERMGVSSGRFGLEAAQNRFIGRQHFHQAQMRGDSERTFEQHCQSDGEQHREYSGGRAPHHQGGNLVDVGFVQQAERPDEYSAGRADQQARAHQLPARNDVGST